MVASCLLGSLAETPVTAIRVPARKVAAASLMGVIPMLSSQMVGDSDG
jgi:hypothetical protein